LYGSKREICIASDREELGEKKINNGKTKNQIKKEKEMRDMWKTPEMLNINY
jgi:hypothetical protein